jgi:threonine/homoserine/homoserine lactone efflux protein
MFLPIIIFFIVFIISFLGSIHPGPLNVSVVEITLKNSLKSGLVMALGGVIPEFIYSWFAVEGTLFFQRNHVIFHSLQWLMVVVLLVMGLATILSKNKNIKTEIAQSGLFVKGFLLSILNPQLLVFWLLICVYFQGIEFLNIDNNFKKIAFVMGTGLGAFALNYLYAMYAFAKKDFIFQHINQKLFNILIGSSFLAMAIFQIVKLFSSNSSLF